MGQKSGVLKLEVRFERPDSTWRHIILKAGGQEKTVWIPIGEASYAYKSLRLFFQHILDNDLPYEFSHDEEGSIVRFVAKLNPNSELFDFILDNGETKIFIEGTFNRKDFVSESLGKMDPFILGKPGPGSRG